MPNASDNKMISNDRARWEELKGIYGRGWGLYATWGDTTDWTPDE